MVDKNLKCDPENKESEENSDVNEGANCIVIKPIIKIDVNISGLNTGTITG